MFPPFPPPGACSRFWPVLFPAAGFVSMGHAAWQAWESPVQAAARNCRQKKGARSLSRPHAPLVRFLPFSPSRKPGKHALQGVIQRQHNDKIARAVRHAERDARNKARQRAQQAKLHQIDG